MLRTNRRSNDEIVRLVSEVGYEGKLEGGRGPGGKVVWYDTRERDNPENREKRVGTSYINVHEAQLTARRVMEALDNGAEPSSIGVTAPYAAQVALIKRKLARHLYTRPDVLEKISFQVATVDSFQGDERDSMYVSMVVSNMEGRVGFVEELRRLRVALSRARNELHIVGNSQSLVDLNKDPASHDAFERALNVTREVGEVRVLPPLQKGRSRDAKWAAN
jgi:superfamily I DNA and/or RNA helicase